MRKFLTSAVVALSALLGSTLPSTAVPVMIGPLGTWPTFPNADNIGFFEATLPDSSWIHRFDLNTTTLATTLEVSAFNPAGNIPSILMFLLDNATLTLIASDSVPEADNSLIFSVANLPAGSYRLDVTGGFAPGATYNGSITLTFPSEVPLPATLPLFATGLGVLGLLGWWRKRKAAAH